ncbi:MAG: phage holin family protein [Halopseudomonas sp.]|uniref:phage holin family protein n=1 Tax=Halopseudomonas sp. TaxID=2901191 RepID=UPI00300151B5
MMIDLSTLAASTLCGFICWRVATFRRDGARYRLGMSLCAYLLAVGTGGYWLSVTLCLLTKAPIAPISPFLVIVFIILAVLVWQARGNVAAVLRKAR